MSTKERILERLEQLDEEQLEALEKELEAQIKRLALEREFQLLRELAEPMSEEDQVEFNQAVKRLPWLKSSVGT